MSWHLKTFVILGALLLPVSSACAAGFEGPGTHATVTQASQAMAAPDETPCVLEGTIVEKVPRHKNRYIFQDKSGRVMVEIRPRVFGDFTVTPNDVVRLVGEVDFDGKYPKIVEVEYLGILGPVSQNPAPQRPAAQPGR